MAKKNSYITVTDQFCGAGGSSQGVRRYVQRTGLGSGMEVKLAMNHWKLALETHATNFPDTDHVATDIQACNPKDYPSTTILITSPECTNHSVAKGKKQVKAQMDAFDQGTHDAVNVAVMACEQFCNSYPVASDALVNQWCRENSTHVVRVVLGGRDKVLAQLIR